MLLFVTHYNTWFFLVIALALLTQVSMAREDAVSPAVPPSVQSAAEGPTAAEQELEQNFLALIESITNVKNELIELKRQLRAAQDDVDKKKLTGEIDKLTLRQEKLEIALEEFALGGVDLDLFRELPDTKFDWKKELQDVVKPLLIELKKLSERPRMIEKLRSEQKYYQARLPIAQRAVQKIEELKKVVASPPLKKELTGLEAEWKKRRDELNSQLMVVTFQLEDALAPDPEDEGKIAASFKEFFSGRGLNFLLALGSFLVVYFSLIYASRFFSSVVLRRKKRGEHFIARLSNLLFQSLTVILALFVAMVMLYFRGDFLILGLLVIFLFGIAWTLRQSVPRYLTEAKILLNIGPVREGERVMYNGIPWTITSLNVSSTLQNPLLRRGTIRLSIEEVANLHSRRYAKEEPWFPSRENDFVILDGDVFGKVLLQTPEIVQLQVIGSVKTFSIENYLGKNPRNLSIGNFSIAVTFGLDYKHQAEITTTVLEQLKAFIGERLQEQPYSDQLKELIIDFNEAGASSLDFIIVAVFSGDAAEHYWGIRRFLQRTAVNACNQYGWTIPFNQLTIHTEPGS